MPYFDPGQNFGSTSTLLSKYTFRKGDCVSREQWGCAAKILTSIEVQHGNRPHYTFLGCPKNVVVVWQTTVGWRNAPASAQRVSTRGLARISSILLKNTMNTAGLEWFGPPERNTLCPLCIVLPCLERVCESLELSSACVCGVLWRACRVQRAPPFYISREAHSWPLGPRQMGSSV